MCGIQTIGGIPLAINGIGKSRLQATALSAKLSTTTIRQHNIVTNSFVFTRILSKTSRYANFKTIAWLLHEASVERLSSRKAFETLSCSAETLKAL